MQLTGEVHGLLAIAGDADDFAVRHFAEEALQALAGRRLVVDDQHPLAHSEEIRVLSSTHGKRRRTMYSSPRRAASTEERPG